jgi:hypothetical protein
MSTDDDFLHQILRLRKQCLENRKDDNSELMNFYDELINWQERIIDELKKFIKKKYEEIKKKYFEINEQKIRNLDYLYSNYIDQKYYSQLIENSHSSIEIFYPKTIDFNSYLQFNINNLNDISSSLALNNHWNLKTYQFHSTLSIQSNLTPLFATYEHLLVYYDHHISLASLHIFDLKTYLEQSNNHHQHSCLKLRVPCNQFQGKIMHMEYSECLQGFLLSTGSKLFLLQISNKGNNYYVKEYFDIAHRNYLGILQKFRTTSKFIYLLIKTLSDHTLVRMDLSKIFCKGKKWIYPKDVNHKNDFLTTDKSHSQLININDFILGKDRLIFAVTYQTNKSNISYELHIRSLDMCLQNRFTLNSNLCPLYLCMIPCDYSFEQFLLIYEKSKILSIYNFNDNDNKIQLINEINLDTEPEYIGFVNNNQSILLLRNHFDIAIYKHMNNT